ncbi:DUF6282 family protein [Lutispora sp.]|uniref:DUF6282 family protein n=1 Tax=Lutispora sp. TaxID=2828727 RepID=UPI002B21A7F7|nr:DUF6282 family protein [Lutispora sp.]MEA4961384.1 DUF6282 family protein [Lutispora sp.]
MRNCSRTQAAELLYGAYDLHVHTAPSHFQRSLDDFELLEQAEEYGMAGVLIKSHYEPTGARAVLVNRRYSDFKARAYGAVALNHPVGGLNPYAVESALKMGASYVWMPTRDSYHCLLSGNMPGDFFSRPGIRVMDESGCLRSEVYDIFDVVKKYDACLGTGHLSPEESMLLCSQGRKRGVRMVLTHPEWQRTVVSLPVQKQLMQKGVLIEKNWINICEGACTAEYMAHTIRILGSKHVYLATDRGQAGFESPAEGMLRFIQTLLSCGITEPQITDMIVRVPQEVIHPTL